MAQSALSLFEVESFVRSLAPMGLATVGSDAWMVQHDRLERLNIAAHLEAQSGKHDEFVVDQFNSQAKVETLIHELLVIEAWKARVFPLLLDHFSPVTAVKAYIVLYHEATLCNLLEVLMYHAATCETAGEAMLELGDFCVRKITALTTGQFKALQADKKEDSKATLDRNTQQSLQQQHLDIGFSVAVCATSLLRFLSDHVNVLPLGVVSRMLHTHDVLLTLVPLVESPPWTRRRDGKCEKFSDQRWVEVKREDTMMMTKLEGQVWLTIYNLIMDKACRKQYQYNTHRKEVLVRLKRFFTELLLDQLPLLRELKRFIEELAIMEPPPPTASSMAIIEQVPEMREAILAGVDFAALAATAKNTVFANDERARQRDIARLAATYNLDNFEDVLPAASCGACGTSHGDMKRCSRCKNEWYCGRACQVAAWKTHQKVCDLMAKDAASKPSAPSAAAAKPATKPAATAAATPAPAKATPAATATPTPAPKPAAAAPAAAAKSAVAAAAAPKAAPKPTPAATPAPAPVAAAAPTKSAFASGKIVMLDEDDDAVAGPDQMD